MVTENLDEAIESLRNREGCLNIKPIGVIKKNEVMPEFYVKKLVYLWLKNQDLDAVIWTNLGPRFNNANGIIPSLDEAINYLKNLPVEEKALAETYIRRTPANIRTKYRISFEEVFQWLPDSDK
ncbi:hypothetical protein D3C86_1828070 [compost metagenome]